jgi:hypothetical protein
VLRGARDTTAQRPCTKGMPAIPFFSKFEYSFDYSDTRLALGTIRDESSRMNSPRIQGLLDRARECDAMALSATLADVREIYSQLARQWWQLARQVQELERERGP